MKINAFNLDLSTSHHRSESLQIQRETKFYHILNQVSDPDSVQVGIPQIPTMEQFQMELEKMRQLLEAIMDILSRDHGVSLGLREIRRLSMPVLEYGISHGITQTQTIQEVLQFKAAGKVTTAEGKHLDIDLALTMESSMVQEFTQIKETKGVAFIDPLLIHLDATLPTTLSGVEFDFDMDMDGDKEAIIAPQSGSGFLVLDMNKDGIINDGSELFGPSTGNGFQELALHDKDQNGWIDENDPIYENLSLWGLGTDGKMEMKGLKEAGVGAIFLKAGNTPFDIRDGDQNMVARVKRSSLALGEDGQPMALQELDWTA